LYQHVWYQKTKPLNEDEIIHQAKKYNIPIADNYILDTSFYQFLVKLKDTSLEVAKNNHTQPLQVLYYNQLQNWQMVSYHANCYTGGFPNLNWNRNGVFNTFIPYQQAPLDNLLTLKKHFEYLRSLTGVQPFNTINYDYIVLVYWSKFMGRQSKRLIQLVQDNAKLANDKKVKVIYVNNDNFFHAS
jgi:hypothetical protein